MAKGRKDAEDKDQIKWFEVGEKQQLEKRRSKVRHRRCRSSSPMATSRDVE